MTSPGRKMYTLTCETCALPFESPQKWRKFCRPEHFAKKVREPGSYTPPPSNGRHKARLKAAPGLDEAERKLLRDKWKKQGRLCVYCTSEPGVTLDHVIPLLHGGTNHEGNLAPACRSCNSRKSSLLVIEMKAGRLSPSQQNFLTNPTLKGLRMMKLAA